MTAKIEIAPINRIAVMAFVLCIGAGAAVSAGIHSQAPVIVGAAMGLYRGKRRRSVSARRESFWVRQKPRFQTVLSKQPPPMPKIRWRCTCAP